MTLPGKNLQLADMDVAAASRLEHGVLHGGAAAAAKQRSLNEAPWPVSSEDSALVSSISGICRLNNSLRGWPQMDRLPAAAIELRGCNPELQKDVDFPGNDILQIFSLDAHHCQLACTQHHSCLFFSFLRSDWTENNDQFYCYLKHTGSGKPPNILSRKGITSGYALNSCKDHSRKTCLSTVYKDIDVIGLNYAMLYVVDYEDCQKACTKDPGCQIFSFANEHYSLPQFRNGCWLKHFRVFPSPPKVQSSNGMTSGFSHKICTGSSTGGKNCLYKLQTNTNFPGYDFDLVPSPSPEYCQFLCTIHPHCTFYSYARDTMICYLKNTKEGRSHTLVEGVTSGYPTRFCESSAECVRTSYGNVDFPGSDRRNIWVNNAQSCQEACTSDPDCQFYTYVHGEKCYLKHVMTVPVPLAVHNRNGVVSGFHLRDC